MIKIDNIRNEYTFSDSPLEGKDKNPFKLFEKWMDEALNSEEKEPTAAVLSTCGSENFPSSRIVLLKFANEEGFVFFTNYESQKGKEIEKNPAVGLNFFWPALQRQVRITGFAEKTSREISEKYFHSRPWESQISAWASAQSSEIPSRKYLEQKFTEFQNFYPQQIVPLPPYWGGYRVVPEKIEFWQGRANRLHDRILYFKKDEKWELKRLAP